MSIEKEPISNHIRTKNFTILNYLNQNLFNSAIFEKLILALLIISYYLFLYLNEQDRFNSQVLSRLGPAINFVLDRDFSLGVFDFTIDKSVYLGNYYTDKPIGLTLLSIPFVFILKLIFQVGNGDYFYLYNLSSKFITVFIIPSLLLLSSYLLYSTSSHFYKRRLPSIYIAFSYSFSSLAYLWSNSLFDHTTVSSLLLILVCICFYYAFSIDSLLFSSEECRILLIGFIAGLLFSIQIQSIIPILFILIISFIFNYCGPNKYNLGRRLIKFLIISIIGFVIAYLPSMIYYLKLYNAPFYISYSDVQGFELMKKGLYGITYFNWHTFRNIIFSNYRGIFIYSPISTLYPLGFILFFLKKEINATKKIFLLGIVFFVCSYYLFLNSSYEYWDGGWSTGPRHIIAITGTCSIPLGALFDLRFASRINSIKKVYELFLIYIFGMSSFYSSFLLSISAQVPNNYKNPISEYFVNKAISSPIESLINISISLFISSLACFILSENLKTIYKNKMTT